MQPITSVKLCGGYFEYFRNLSSFNKPTDTMVNLNEYVKLSSGYLMPLIGFGTYTVKGKDVILDMVDESLKVGFRSIDTAAGYGNEAEIGAALKIVLPKYNLKREDIFVTTKLAPCDNGNPSGIRASIENSLTSLGLSYLDLYLIHWPGASGIREESNENARLRDITWKTLVDIQKEGLIRSIGVSNYDVKHLRELLNNTYGVKPAVNQVECHPHFRQEELINFCKAEQIFVQAYSSLGTSHTRSLLDDPVVVNIAREIDVSPARLLLKWAVEQNIGIIPKATKKEHIHDNVNLDFKISEERMKILSNLPQQKYAWNPSKKTGKPNDSEWTVLAGFVVKDGTKFSVASLATGTKCLSGKELTNLESWEIGARLSDSHAEILARRAFLRYLYHQIDLTARGNSSSIFEMDHLREIRLRNSASFHFYSSQTPCGDCSIFPQINEQVTPDPSYPVKKRKIQTIDEESIPIEFNDVHRTGAKCVDTETSKDSYLPGIDYHSVGPLRTKPGRGDRTFSLSCSDKLAKWNVIGIQGALLSLLVPTLKLESLVVGGGCPFSIEAMERGIYRRFDVENNIPLITRSSMVFDEQKGGARIQPCPSSVIWCDVPDRPLEISVDGRKQGVTKKKAKGNYLLISRRELFRTFLRTVDCIGRTDISERRHPKKITYLQAKSTSVVYQSCWRNFKMTKFRTWPAKPALLKEFVL